MPGLEERNILHLGISSQFKFNALQGEEGLFLIHWSPRLCSPFSFLSRNFEFSDWNYLEKSCIFSLLQLHTYLIAKLNLIFSAYILPGRPFCSFKKSIHRVLKHPEFLIRQRRTRVNSPPLAAFHCLYRYPADLRRGSSISTSHHVN
jgi:hypothetical protein